LSHSLAGLDRTVLREEDATAYAAIDAYDLGSQTNSTFGWFAVIAFERAYAERPGDYPAFAWA
jgi:hypothetical protein